LRGSVAVLIAYIDEFGHVGPYISAEHPKYSQHPVFGYAGFIIPAAHAREMGVIFKHVKSTLFKAEIAKSSALAQWERKGSEYFSTGSITTHPGQVRAFKGLTSHIRRLDGRLFYYGEEKKLGTLKETGIDSVTVMHDALRETINRVCRHAEGRRRDVMILADSFTDKTRQELASRMYAHIYARSGQFAEMRRIVEAPLHIESKLNSGIQLADWIAGLASRASHYQLVQASEFGWASERFAVALGGMFTYESKIRVLEGEDIHHGALLRRRRTRFPTDAVSPTQRVKTLDW
jgi:hypothetical protein